MKLLSLFAQANDYYSNESLFNDSSYQTYATQTVDPAAATAAMVGFLVTVLIASLIGYVISAIFLGMIFKKAGVEPWKAWVPIYNMWILLELGDQKGYWAVLSLIPVVNIVAVVFLIMAEYRIGLKLQKEGWFVILAIFLSPVWLIWLAVDKSTWEGQKPTVATANGAPAPTPTVSDENTPPPAQTPPTV